MENPASRPGSRERQVRLPKSPGSERRASTRYPLGLAVRYTVLQWRPTQTGTGRSVDLSASGLRFTADRTLEPGLNVELAISWPLLLDGEVQLQLVVSGTVVWSAGTEVALKIHRHEFKTRRAGLKLV